MDKYLIQILKEVNTIIIPGLGALTIVDATSGEVMFMPYLNYDDGKLSQYIAEREGWEENEAKNLIAKYVRDVTTKLDQGDSYDMYEFGSFRKDESGDVQFISWDGKTDSSTPIVENEPKVEQVESVQEIEEKVEEVSSQEAEITEEPIIVSEPEKEMVSEEEQWNDDLDVPPVNFVKEEVKKPILEKAQKDKKGKKKILLPILLLVLLGGATVAVFTMDSIRNKIPFLANHDSKEIQSEVSEKEEAEVNNSEEEPIEDVEETINSDLQTENTDENATTLEEDVNEVPIEEPIETTVQVSSPGKYSVDKKLPVQVIVGSFTEESNAQNKINQMKSLGYEASIIGRYDNLYLVSLASFNSYSEAKAELTTIGGITPHYWVFNKN